MTPRIWTPDIVRPPGPVVDGALRDLYRRERKQERDRWKHIRDPRVERSYSMLISSGVGPSQAQSVTTQAVATLLSTTAGRSLVLFADWVGAGITITGVDVSGQAMDVHGSPAEGDGGMSGFYLQCASLKSLSSGGTKTITITWSSSVGLDGHIWVKEYAGGNTTTFFDAVNSAKNAASANPTVSLPTVADNCHVIGYLANEEGGALTAGTGYTLFAADDIAFFMDGEEDTDFDAGTAGSKTVNFTRASGSWLLLAASFKPDAGGGGGPVGPDAYLGSISQPSGHYKLSMVPSGVMPGRGI
jgi:hypothetical protein